MQCLVHYLIHVSMWALTEGRPEAAASLLRTVHTFREEHLAGTGPAFELAWIETAQDALGPEEFERSFEDGSANDPGRSSS